MVDVAAVQLHKVRKQVWKLQWSGRLVREKAERIVFLASQWSGLVSLAMNSAPPCASMPWAPVTALLPMMLIEFKEHQAATEGLESTTKLSLGYQLAEPVFLGQMETRDKYK